MERGSMSGLRLPCRTSAPARFRYAVAALSVAVAFGIARWPALSLESAPVSLFLCAVMLSAWFGGAGPGILAAALSVTTFATYFVPPGEVPRLAVFAVAVLLVGSLSAAQRRASESLREAGEALRETQAALAHVTRVMTMGELAASIAHEVNQPLAGIVINGNACLRWLAGEPPDLDEAREAAQRIIRDGTRASDIVARVRALARKTVSEPERVDLNEAIREVLALAQGEARRHKAALHMELAHELPPVWGDRVQLQQVVLNLIINGIEAMSGVEDRARELVIRTQRGDGPQVHVTVHDTGVGFDPQMLERVFDAFHTTKPGGMGMGLSISRTIVENHAGRLSVVAHDGPGATVQFTLPAYV